MIPEPPETERYRALLDVSESIALYRELPELFHHLAGALHNVVRFDFLVLLLHDPRRSVIRLHVLETSEPARVEPGFEAPVDRGPGGMVWSTQRPWILEDIERESGFPETLELLRAHEVRSSCALPLTTAHRRLGVLGFGSKQPRAYGAGDLHFLERVAAQVAVAVDNALAYQEIARLKEKLAEEKLYLEDEIRTEYNFEEIIGESPVWKRALREVEIVAPTGSTVLIRGESGTGKELIARAIHNLSTRRERTFVKVNCAAIPTGLLESELFGHERGAFTGAISQRVGRFELANGGTLFLDEIGDIPLELQPKLLRVLQEREFERLGGNRTQRVDVRLITATHHDLGAMVAAEEFRSDLYYRLNVFPITLPPLRERPEDVPLLVRYFAQKFARRMNKRIETIPAPVMQTLVRWPWPGNVRELENVIERAVILSPGPALCVSFSEFETAPPHLPRRGVATMRDAEREHILRALRESGGQVGGPRGAAARLGMKRTTLQSRMRKLGIRPAEISS
ncbi:MAG: sigma 54-interacting transcriptional regulator [Bryobacteraceae bacterium]